MPTETEGDKRPATKAEKIEQLMGVTWEVEESDKLRAFAEKILRSAEIGEIGNGYPTTTRRLSRPRIWKVTK